MTDCGYGNVRDALPDYLNDRLDTAHRREVESHLAGCDACREELSLLRTLHVTMRRAPAVNVDAIAAAIPAYRAPVRRGWATPWRVAAAIVALAAGGTSIALLRSHASVQREDVSPYVTATRTREPGPAPQVVAPSTRAAEVPARPAPRSATIQPAPTRELAIASGSIGDLSDAELAALVDDIESLEATPAAEVESAEPLSVGAQEGT